MSNIRSDVAEVKSCDQSYRELSPSEMDAVAGGNWSVGAFGWSFNSSSLGNGDTAYTIEKDGVIRYMEICPR